MVLDGLDRPEVVGSSTCGIHADIMLSSSRVPHLQVKDVPAPLHDRLRSLARETNRTLSAAVLAAVEREVAAWEWKKRLAERPATDLGVDAATLIAEARARRNRPAGPR